VVATNVTWFVVHDIIYAERTICYRPSVCLSVTRVDESQTVEVRIIMQLSPHGSAVHLDFAVQVLSRNSDGCPLSGGIKQKWGGENKLFSSFIRRYLENDTSYDQTYYYWLIGSCVCAFDWHQGRWPWMTLNCYKFKFYRNFVLLHIFGRQQQLNKWK